MTQQFKFGDRLRNLDGKEFIYLRPEGDACVVVSILGNIHRLRGEFFERIPHPDTERLDWLAAQDDISITLGNAINLKLPDLRTATDAAMQAQAAEAKAT